MAPVRVEHRRYRRVYPRIWRNPTFQQLSHRGKIVALYLLTGPQTNRIGLYRLSITAAAEDLDLRASRVIEAITGVCSGFNWEFSANAYVSIGTKRANSANAHARIGSKRAGAYVVYIPSWFAFNPLSDNANNFKGCLSDLSDVPSCPLITLFRNNLTYIPESLHHLLNIEHRSNTVGNTVPNTVSNTVPDTVPNTVRTQEQEQEQEQDSTYTRAVHTENFEAFWRAYPRKVSREASLKEWLKLKPDADLVDTILRAVNDQRQTSQWLRDGGQFIPYPRTWLHQRRWADELQVDKAPPPPPEDDGCPHAAKCSTPQECYRKMREDAEPPLDIEDPPAVLTEPDRGTTKRRRTA